jgi:hypothetical protein
MATDDLVSSEADGSQKGFVNVLDPKVRTNDHDVLMHAGKKGPKILFCPPQLLLCPFTLGLKCFQFSNSSAHFYQLIL